MDPIIIVAIVVGVAVLGFVAYSFLKKDSNSGPGPGPGTGMGEGSV